MAGQADGMCASLIPALASTGTCRAITQRGAGEERCPVQHLNGRQRGTRAKIANDGKWAKPNKVEKRAKVRS